MRIRTPAFLLVALFFATACTPPPPATQAPAPSRNAAVDPPRSGSIFFWRASRTGKPGNVYLVGSVHMLGGKGSLDRAITDAAATCERGAFELDLDAVDPNETADFIRSDGVLKDQTLKDVVSPETFATWTRAVDRHQLPRAAFEKFKPWLAAIVMQSAVLDKRGIVEERGIDHMLYAFEKQEPSRSRVIVGLETALEQLKVLGSASPEIQDLMLRSTAKDLEKNDGRTIFTLYETGNEAGMADYMSKSRTEIPETKAYWEALIDQRNITMTDKIVPMFDTAGCTVVTVGVGHLVGESGILRRLRDKGFDLERVSSRGPTDAAKMAFTVRQPQEFLSREDGFSVRTSTKPTLQEGSVPGMSVKSRSYVFSYGATMALTLTVLPFPDAATASKVSTLLERVARAGLAMEGVKVIGAEPTVVAGERAVLVRGENSEGDVRAASSITWVHANRLYSITAKFVGDGDRKRLEERMANFVEGFRHAP